MSTNERFHQLLEEAVHEAYDKRVKDANRRMPRKRLIQRLTLYGVGFGGRLPRVCKRKKKSYDDPDTIAMIKSGCTLGRCASTQVVFPPEPPPCALGDLRYEHENLYKAFVHGSLSRHDPERMFVSAMYGNSDGAGGHRPAWFYGTQDKGCMSTHYLMAARRYGYRGSHALRERNTPQSASSVRTVRHETPEFLRGQQTVVNEWTPTMVAAPPKVFHPLLSTPKLWPSNTEYVEGYKPKAKSRSYLYNKETTVNTNFKPPDPRSIKTVRLDEEENDVLEQAMAVERHFIDAYDTDQHGLKTRDAMQIVEDQVLIPPTQMGVRSGRHNARRRHPHAQRTVDAKSSSSAHASPRTHAVHTRPTMHSAGTSGSTSELAPPGSASDDGGSVGFTMSLSRDLGATSPPAAARHRASSPHNQQDSWRGKTPPMGAVVRMHDTPTDDGGRRHRRGVDGRGVGKGRGKGVRRSKAFLQATVEYQERKRQGKMQLSSNEAILVKRRAPKSGDDGADDLTESKRRNLPLMQYQLKWFAVRHLYEVMVNSRLPGRPLTSVNLVASLTEQLQSHAEANEAKSMISREAFINTLLGKYGSRMQENKANLIFSTFDPMSLNRIHYANVIACLTILEHPNEPPRKKLQRLYRLYMDHRKDRNALDNIVSIMTTCSSTAADAATADRTVKDTLIPYLYRTMALKPSAVAQSQLEVFSQTQKEPGLRLGKVGEKQRQARERERQQQKRAEEDAALAEAQAHGGSRMGNGAAQKAGKAESVAASVAGRAAMAETVDTDVVYNLCNEALGEEDFKKGLAACPQVVELFHEQMRCILGRQAGQQPDIRLSPLSAPTKAAVVTTATPLSQGVRFADQGGEAVSP